MLTGNAQKHPCSGHCAIKSSLQTPIRIILGHCRSSTGSSGKRGCSAKWSLNRSCSSTAQCRLGSIWVVQNTDSYDFKLTPGIEWDQHLRFLYSNLLKMPDVSWCNFICEVDVCGCLWAPGRCWTLWTRDDSILNIFQYDQIWSNMIKYDQIWSNMIKYHDVHWVTIGLWKHLGVWMAAAFHPSGRTALWCSFLSAGGRTPRPGAREGRGIPGCFSAQISQYWKCSRITCLPVWEAKHNMIAIVDCMFGLHGADDYAFPQV